MKAQRLEALPAPVADRSAARPPAAVLAQRHSTFGGGGAAAAPPVLDSGRQIEPATRHEMERGFGRDFSAVRIHDDARAHESARGMGALAYAAGNHIVFGEGQYSPGTAAGRSLLAHELAHTVQQSGVQRKVDGPLPLGTDARLEAEADGAARAVAAGRPVPQLSQVSAPAVFRTEAAVTTDPAAAPTGTAGTQAASVAEYDIPGIGKIKIEEDEPAGAGTQATFSRVTMPQLDVPHKGSGDWVKAGYALAASGGSLLYRGTAAGGKFTAATDPVAGYRDVWAKKYGFASLKDIAVAINAYSATKPLSDPKTADILKGFAADSLLAAKCDVDHIVEKQLQGSNIANNLQLLSASVNRSAGSRMKTKLADLANKVKANARPNLKQVILQFPVVNIENTPEVSDDYLAASLEIESLLRSPNIKGNAALAAVADGNPVGLLAGGKSAVAFIKPTGTSDIGSPAKLLITGMRLEQYNRATNSVTADPVIPGLRTDDKLKLTTLKVAAQGPVKVLGNEPGKEELPAPVEKGPEPTEYRQLNLPEGAARNLKANFPFMSPVKFKSLEIKPDGLHGTGTITPTIGFIPPVDIVFTPTTLEMVTKLTPDKLKTPAQAFFRFTAGELNLKLVPFLPSGRLDFNAGPASSPLIKGFVNAAYKDGALVATGELEPAGPIPGIDKAKGKVEYHSQKGWSGALVAESGALMGSKITGELGFRPGKNGIDFYGEGGFSTTVKDSPLNLKMRWEGGTVSYWGGVTVPNPMPLVKSVSLDGSYANDLLKLTGSAPIKWRGIDASMSVTYRHKAGEEKGKFSGGAKIDFPAGGKVGGSLDLNFDELGNFWGKGTVSYQLTPTIRPKLAAEYGKDGKLKMSGEVELADIELTKEWPQKGGARKPIIKGLGFKFSVPTPVAGVTAYGEVKGSLGVAYGIGPVMLKGVKLSGSLYPLEDDPKPEVKLTGRFTVPAYAELYGTFGAYIGAEVLLGAAGAKGGIEVTPSLRVSGEGGIAFDAAYSNGGFSFAAEAYAKGGLTAKLKVDFAAKIYLLGDIGPSWEWKYPLAAVSRQIGPELTLTLGKVAYAPDGKITWPSLDQISVNPKDIDPYSVIEGLMKEGKESKT